MSESLVETPSHLVINPAVASNIYKNPTRDYKIDVVTDAILAEVVQLLPCELDEYWYSPQHARSTVGVTGLGEIHVALRNARGVFQSISEVCIGDFRIWNCRQTGFRYNDTCVDHSSPGTIALGDAEHTQIELFDGTASETVYVQKSGKRFTNHHPKTQSSRHGGYNQTVLGCTNPDQLHRTFNGLWPNGPVRAGEAPNEGWQGDPTIFSWQSVQDKAIGWMADNILLPLVQVTGSQLPSQTPLELVPQYQN
ncbi:MAG TPA: hypothetical protein VLG16_00950 [Candidatus Saccharimonadales bacterium]|nr:hypothetical protein [Candidatus Saccharimonadales bacterium]